MENPHVSQTHSDNRLCGLRVCASLGEGRPAHEVLDEIVVQAKQEGEVTWFNWYFEPEFRTVVTAFEEKYGIKVTIPDVNSAEDVVSKVMAEKDLAKTDVASSPWAARPPSR